jgi:hypothetical protein
VDGIVTGLFLLLWIAVGFFVLRYFGRKYFHEPRRADVAAIGVAVAFALGAIWPYSARFGTTVGTAPSPASTTAQSVAALGPSAARDTSKACRSIKLPFGKTPYGSIDVLRSDGKGAPSVVVADNGEMDRTEGYFVEGWVVEPDLSGPALGVCLVVDGKLDLHDRTYYGLSRPDVALGYHRDELNLSGYRVQISPGALPPGKHQIQVVTVTAPGSQGLLVPIQRNVTVK